ncbi:MAG: LysR substrate-binding domain-containing protein, partial [Comamonas sp.]
VDEALRREDLRFAPAFEVDHIATIGALLSAGLGVGVLPETACELIAHRGLVTRALRAPGIQRPLGLVRRRSPQLSPAAQALRALLVAHFQVSA